MRETGEEFDVQTRDGGLIFRLRPVLHYGRASEESRQPIMRSWSNWSYEIVAAPAEIDDPTVYVAGQFATGTNRDRPDWFVLRFGSRPELREARVVAVPIERLRRRAA